MSVKSASVSAGPGNASVSIVDELKKREGIMQIIHIQRIEASRVHWDTHWDQRKTGHLRKEQSQRIDRKAARLSLFLEGQICVGSSVNTRK